MRLTRPVRVVAVAEWLMQLLRAVCSGGEELEGGEELDGEHSGDRGSDE